MSKETALTKARLLKAVMLDHGIPEVSIELQTGRPNPYDEWDSLRVVADMSHHTVSRYDDDSLTPVLALCKRGRSDVPGPLCNGYGGWDLTYRIITFSYANHPGAGGPLTVTHTGSRYTIPKDSARRYTWGTEYEGGIAESDWDRLLTNPRNGIKMTFREFMGRSNSAIQEFFRIDLASHLEHSSWTTRKIDRLNYTRSEGQTEIKKYSGPVLVEDEFMGFIDDQAEFTVALSRALDDIFKANDLASPPETIHSALRHLRVAPWHQELGRSGKSMHQVIGEIHAVVTQLPALVAEAGDEIGLTPEQAEALAASIASKVERVTVVVEE